MTEGDGDRFVAFHRPDHFIVRLAAPFFVERFRTMRWSILTPDECAHWDGAELSFTEGVDARAAPDEDAIENVWRTYYASTFNPARINTRAMVRELPVRHWRTLPEAQIIPDLVAAASSRVDRMLSEPGVATSARPFVPAAAATLDDLRDAAASCRGCPLFAEATQVVFGEGPPGARLMLVGEQPGDEEDLNGRPFVGPAGRVLAEALEQAGLQRGDLYLTNAVKHFTFRREGKRRIHERPRLSDVRACRPWLASEIEQVKPAVIVCLGSTAAQAVLGPRVRIQRDRGRAFDSAWAKHVIPTYHPSAVLRAEDEQHGRDVFAWLVEDLRHAVRLDATPPSRLP
jgi:DNA polymerase